MSATIFCIGGAGCEVGRIFWGVAPEYIRKEIKHLVFIDSDIAEVGYLDDQSQGKLFEWRKTAHERDKIEIFNISILDNRIDLRTVFEDFINNPEVKTDDPNLEKVMQINKWQKWADKDFVNAFASGVGGVSRRRSASFGLFLFNFFYTIENYDRLYEITNAPGVTVIITAFGGGTGSGGHLQFGRLVRYLRKAQGDIYLVGILPNLAEGDIEKANTLYTLVEHVHLGKIPYGEGWYDGNPFSQIFLFDGNAFYNKYKEEWSSYIDRAISDFISNFLSTLSAYQNFESFDMMERRKQCNDEGRLFVYANTHTISYPMRELCVSIDKSVETMRLVSDLNRIEKEIHGYLDLRGNFEDFAKKYGIEIKPGEYGTKDALDSIRAYSDTIKNSELKIVENSGKLMSVYRGEYEAELTRYGELICNYINTIQELSKDLSKLSLKDMQGAIKEQKKIMKRKILGLVILAIVSISVAGTLLFLLQEEGPQEDLTLSDYPRLFEKEVVIVIGETATEMEYESILRKPWNEGVFFSGYASAVGLIPHSVVSHTKGEDGADFRIDMHDPHTWNASINNTGNVTLTSIKVIVGGKVIQEIPNLEVDKQKDLVTLQSWEYPSDCTLYIVCDQEAIEVIELSHTVGGSYCFFDFNWHTLPGLILCILGIMGGILTRKRKKLLIPFTIIFFIGILLIVTSSYVCLPS